MNVIGSRHERVLIPAGEGECGICIEARPLFTHFPHPIDGDQKICQVCIDRLANPKSCPFCRARTLTIDELANRFIEALTGIKTEAKDEHPTSRPSHKEDDEDPQDPPSCGGFRIRATDDIPSIVL